MWLQRNAFYGCAIFDKTIISVVRIRNVLEKCVHFTFSPLSLWLFRMHFTIHAYQIAVYECSSNAKTTMTIEHTHTHMDIFRGGFWCYWIISMHTSRATEINRERERERLGSESACVHSALNVCKLFNSPAWKCKWIMHKIVIENHHFVQCKINAIYTSANETVRIICVKHKLFLLSSLNETIGHRSLPLSVRASNSIWSSYTAHVWLFHSLC